jgi:hypothetical protein
MEIPGIGSVTKDSQSGWYCSGPVSVKVLGGQPCQFVLDGYEDDPKQQEFHAAIAKFLSIDRSVLERVEKEIYKYYEVCRDLYGDEVDDFVMINSANKVWPHIQLGTEPVVQRRSDGDELIYISLECECDWEPEHGLQIVFKNGKEVNKIGPFDSHLTNSDAYDNEDLEDVIFVSNE